LCPETFPVREPKTHDTAMNTSPSNQPASTSERTPSVRINTTNADHHLWNNNGTWWCHYTVHNSDHTKQRIRLSLHTAALSVARVLRDSVLLEAGLSSKEVARA
jgi:hypothetical protein